MKKVWRIAGVAVLLLLLLAMVVGYRAWQRLHAPATTFGEDSRVLYIPTGSGFGNVVDSLRAIGALRDEQGFRWLAERKRYQDRVKPGRYRVPQGMRMEALVDMLRAGGQEPVRVTFTNIQRLPELAGRIAAVLEPDSAEFLDVFRDPATLEALALDEATVIGLFLPNTYEMWWTTSPERFMARMQREYEAFWNADRKAKAERIGLSPMEVGTLASIVQAETVMMSDAPRIAGVYLNRLRIGMPLQADPTLKFALGLDTVRRILDRDKEVDSPYNTYRHKGLPPGPINMPEPRFIDAVLNAEKHDYLYFCARADMSGHSEFARTYQQHLVNARRYQRALDQRGILR
jgi:UPF0755 protein